MGTGKVLPTLIILSISAMMIFSILPAMAHISTPEGICPGEQGDKSPWHKHLVEKPGEEGDANKNGHVCHNHNAAIVRDDRIPRS